jgi:hypothetical protein
MLAEVSELAISGLAKVKKINTVSELTKKVSG